MSLAIGLKGVEEFKGMKEKEKLVMDGENVDKEGRGLRRNLKDLMNPLVINLF